ncbi:signal peptidase I [Telmatospirillum sp.]|uniref:signal peptidase I n=1 Tax=Telmatospirillum sp. TaxID=2079197 RepID=UPI00284AAD9E|nr:signal peptidase I [Telmatospirillum sp.]MDR3439354.1 signal peptidase I [Telmatospirillum sp.]
MTARPIPHQETSGWRRQVRDIALTLVFVLVAKTVAAEPYYVPSSSMEPTLLIGDELLTTKYPYGYSRYSLPMAVGPASVHRLMESIPKRGDVVVFRLPHDPSQTYVKRVVGLPGDRLQMQDGRLLINGALTPLRPDGIAQAEDSNGSLRSAARFVETLPDGAEHPIFKLFLSGPLDNTPVYEVPAGHLFVMGDNRDNSADSRMSPSIGGVGYVPMENLVGRVDAVIGSWDLTLAKKPVWTWPEGLRLARFFSRVQ